jgi:hypothetical protein
MKFLILALVIVSSKYVLILGDCVDALIPN